MTSVMDRTAQRQESAHISHTLKPTNNQTKMPIPTNEIRIEILASDLSKNKLRSQSNNVVNNSLFLMASIISLSLFFKYRR